MNLIFRDNIKKIRKIHALTQEDFAKKMSVSLDQQKSYEYGKATPGGGYLRNLAAYSGFTETELQKVEISEEAISKKMEEKGENPPSKVNKSEEGKRDYRELYIESLETRITALEEDKKTLQRTVDTNLATIQVLLQSLSNQVTAQSEVTMKALDRVFDQPEGTLGAASDKLEVKMWERIAQIAGRAGIPLQINVNN